MTRFFRRLKEFGIRKIFKGLDFISAVIITLLVIIFIEPTVFDKIIQEFLIVSAQASITLATIILAGFAIIVAITSDAYINFLNKLRVYTNILFVFEFTTMTAIFSFVFAIFLKYFYYHQFLGYVYIFVFSYLILSILSLVAFTSFYGVKRAEFIKIRNSASQSRNDMH